MNRLYTLAGLMLMAYTVLANAIATIELGHRPAEEIIPIVRPMLAADDAISGQGFRIFLQAPPETVNRIRSMIEALDTPARVLEVAVFQGSTDEFERLGMRGSLRIEQDGISADIGSGERSDESSGITYGTFDTTGTRVTLDGVVTNERLTDNPVHRVRVSEGTEAYIETGRQLPYYFTSHWGVPAGAIGSVGYKDVVTGFYVLPRVHGDRVTLEVSPFRNAQNRERESTIDTRSATTTVTGPIGEWFLVGGTTERLERTETGAGNHISTQRDVDDSIWIRADLVQ